jgi:hypothetical protein
MWVPTRPVPTEPKINAVTNERTRRWAELADARYALLLGFIDHYLHATAHVRRVLVGWIFAEMRSRLGFIARELTAMPLSDDPASTEVAACLFTLPPQLTLPGDESARWRVHLDRTTTAIGIAQQLRDGPQDDRLGSFLARLLSSDQARLATMKELATTTSFARDIQPLFRPKDLEHMEFFADFADLEEVKASAQAIIDKLELDDGGDESGDRMPVPPDPRWTPAQVQLLRRWIADDCPP